VIATIYFYNTLILAHSTMPIDTEFMSVKVYIVNDDIKNPIIYFVNAKNNFIYRFF